MLALLLLLVASVVANENGKCPGNFINTQDAASGDVPVCYSDATNKYSTSLLNDDDFIEDMQQLSRERLPERTVHAKGTGAYGHFEVTHDISHICNADFLKEVGKKTPVVVRFATGVSERGSSDYVRDTRGFSVKMYTDEGNFDLLGFSKEMYIYKDPLRFTTVVHAARRSPDSNLHNQTTYWDAITLLPESMNFFIRIFSDEGIPASHRHTVGSAVHTYQVVNEQGDYHFVRFHFIPDLGEKFLTTEEALKRGPDDAIKDLYEAIENGEFPSWTVTIQVCTMAQVKEFGSKLFDPTRLLPKDKFPHQPIGKLVLTKNAKHFQNEIEKLAFNPGNIVRGIVGSPDKLFEARALVYKDAQLYRLGKNHNKIPVNCPIHTIFTYTRDGMPPVGNNEGDTTSYYPNSFDGPQPYDKQSDGNNACKGSGLIKIKQNPFADNFEQVIDFYNELTDPRKSTLIENMKTPLKTAAPLIQERAVNLCTSIHPDFGRRLAEALDVTIPN